MKYAACGRVSIRTRRTSRNPETYREPRLPGKSRERLKPLIASGAILKVRGFRGGKIPAVQYQGKTPSRWQVLVKPDRCLSFDLVYCHIASLLLLLNPS